MRLLKQSAVDIDVITVAQLKKQANIIHSDDDDYLRVLIKQALEQVAIDTNRTLTEAIWLLSGAVFPVCINLPKPPFVELVSIAYVDPDGAERQLPLDSVQVIPDDVGAVLSAAPGYSWPAVQRGNQQAVKIEFKAGYVTGTTASKVGELPASLYQAALLWAAHLYNYREVITPQQVNELPSYRCMVSPFEVNLI